ncbi:MAG: hypothetical protein LBO69_03490 [Ignavibacteria bacterium]|jgi:hypothetical protein|nr:hypothetical protein [Ignavibacteria bacterium]
MKNIDIKLVAFVVIEMAIAVVYLSLCFFGDEIGKNFADNRILLLLLMNIVATVKYCNYNKINKIVVSFLSVTIVSILYLVANLAFGLTAPSVVILVISIIAMGWFVLDVVFSRRRKDKFWFVRNLD